MLTELLDVLARAGYVPPRGQALQDVVVMMRNSLGLPPNPELERPGVSLGFHLVLLDPTGKPTHYVRVQSSGDERFSAECRLLELLAEDPVASSIIPSSKSASGAEVRVHVSQFLTSEKRFIPMPAVEPDDWVSVAEDVLRAKDILCGRAADLVAEFRSPTPRLVLSDVIKEPLSVIAHVPGSGVRPSGIQEILQTLSPVPAHLQHGDFWAGNLLLHRGHWRIIDFEDFGQVYAPLYDTLHLIQTSARSGLWGPDAGWLDVGPFAVPAEWRHAWGQLIESRAKQLELSLQQVGGLILFYLARLTAHRLRPGVPDAFSVMPMSDLRAAIRYLDAGGELQGLIPSGNESPRGL
jgi:hypothetical protein